MEKVAVALNDNKFLYNLVIPTCIKADQDWVVNTESWVRFFSREQETMPWLNQILQTLWPLLNELFVQVRRKIYRRKYRSGKYRKIR